MLSVETKIFIAWNELTILHNWLPKFHKISSVLRIVNGTVTVDMKKSDTASIRMKYCRNSRITQLAYFLIFLSKHFFRFLFYCSLDKNCFRVENGSLPNKNTKEHFLPSYNLFADIGAQIARTLGHIKKKN